MSEPESEFGEAIGKIAACLRDARGGRKGWSFLSPGEVSALVRMDRRLPHGAFWRLMMAFVPERMRAGDEAERRWALVCQGMAAMSPHVHDPRMPAGRALAACGFSSEERPIRINRLLRAEGEAFDDLFLSACRFLAAKAQPVDWRGFAAFALHRDETARKRLARDFYARRDDAAEAA